MKVKMKLAGFNTMSWDQRNSDALIMSTAPCHHTQMVVGLYCITNPFHLTVLATMSGLRHCIYHNNFKCTPENGEGECWDHQIKDNKESSP